MSVFLTKELADQAINDFFDEMAQFTIDNEKKGFNVTVLDPGEPHFSVLTERSCNEDEWDGSDYRGIAVGKTALCFREKMNSGDVPRHMLRTGDVKWRGGVYYNGIVVAVSGFAAADDEEFSLKIAKRCEELANEAYNTWHEANRRESFVGV